MADFFGVVFAAVVATDEFFNVAGFFAAVIVDLTDMAGSTSSAGFVVAFSDALLLFATFVDLKSKKQINLYNHFRQRFLLTYDLIAYGLVALAAADEVVGDVFDATAADDFFCAADCSGVGFAAAFFVVLADFGALVATIFDLLPFFAIF